jgi:hypothetical protein
LLIFQKQAFFSPLSLPTFEIAFGRLVPVDNLLRRPRHAEVESENLRPLLSVRP